MFIYLFRLNVSTNAPGKEKARNGASEGVWLEVKKDTGIAVRVTEAWGAKDQAEVRDRPFHI